MEKSYYRLHDIIKLTSVPKTTLLRWEREGKFPAGQRDAHGWRIYTKDDVDEITRFIERQRTPFLRPEEFKNISTPAAFPAREAISEVGVAPEKIEAPGRSIYGVSPFLSPPTTLQQSFTQNSHTLEYESLRTAAPVASPQNFFSSFAARLLVVLVFAAGATLFASASYNDAMKMNGADGTALASLHNSIARPSELGDVVFLLSDQAAATSLVGVGKVFSFTLDVFEKSAEFLLSAYELAGRVVKTPADILLVASGVDITLPRVDVTLPAGISFSEARNKNHLAAEVPDSALVSPEAKESPSPVPSIPAREVIREIISVPESEEVTRKLSLLTSQFTSLDTRLNRAFSEIADLSNRAAVPQTRLEAHREMISLSQKIDELDEISVTNGLTIESGNLVISNGSLTVSGGITVDSITNTGSLTVGDSSADTLTINAGTIRYINTSTSTIPNGVVNAWSLATTTNTSSPFLSIDSLNNRIGIGTSTPPRQLTIDSGNGSSFGVHVAGTFGEYSLANRSLGSGSFIQSPTNGERWAFFVSSTNDQGRLNFWSGTSKFTYTPDPAFGIASTSPGGTLAISSATTVPAFLLNQTSTGDLLTLQDSGATVFTVKDGGNVGIGTSSPARRLAVSDDGTYSAYFSNRVGIGISTPASMLDIYGSGLASIQVHTTDAEAAGIGAALNFMGKWSGTEFTYARVSGHHAAAGGYLSLHRMNSSAQLIEEMRIHESGNVLIGTTTNLGNKVHIVYTGGVAGAGLRVEQSGGAFGSSIPQYGVQSTVTSNLSSVANIAGYFSSTNSPQANYAIIVPSGGGSVGIWDSSPDGIFDVNTATVEDAFLVGTNARVGISTSTPGGLLSVSGGTVYPAFLLNQTSTGDLLTLQDSGSTAFIVKDGGNVGVGTSSPAALFSVSGNSYFTGNVGLGILNPSAKLVITSGGNVGLGTNDIELWVSNSSVIESLDTAIFFGLDTDIHLLSNAYNDSGGWKYKTTDEAANYFQYQGEHIFRVAVSGTADTAITWKEALKIQNDGDLEISGGNIGIGTSAPGGVIDIQKSEASNLLARIYNTGAGETTLRLVAGNATDAQHQWADADEWLASIAVNDISGMQFRLTSSGSASSEAQLDAATRLTIARTGNVGIGTTTPGGLLSVSAAGGIPAFLLNQTSTGDLLTLQDSGSTAFIVKDGGNVGVGTTNSTPLSQHRLTIAQDVVTSADLTAAQIVAAGSANPNKKLILGFNTTDNFGFIAAGEHTVAWRNLALQPAGTGHVGIGTTSPQARLGPSASKIFEVSGGSIPAIVMHSSATRQESLIITDGAGFYFDVGGHTTASNNAFIFRNNNTSDSYSILERMRIASDGNVGIGTAGPTAPLTVAGLISSTTAPILYLKQSSSSDYGYTFRIDNISTGDMYLRRKAAGVDADLLMTWKANGNVRIGTTTLLGSDGLTSDLLITGANRAIGTQGTLSLFASDTVAADMGGTLAFGARYDATQGVTYSMIKGARENATDSNLAGYLAFATRPAGGNVTERVRITSSGNVGIGTSSPAATFSVQGSGLISGSLTAASLTATGTLSVGTTTATNLIISNSSTSTFAGPVSISQAGSGLTSVAGFNNSTNASGAGVRIHFGGASNDRGQLTVMAPSGDNGAGEWVFTSLQGSSGGFQSESLRLQASSTVIAAAASFTPDTSLMGANAIRIRPYDPGGGTINAGLTLMPRGGGGSTSEFRFYNADSTSNVGWLSMSYSGSTLTVSGSSAGSGTGAGTVSLASGLRLLLSGNGQHGIGTTTPGALLSISAATTVPAFLLNQTSTGDLLTLQDSGTNVFRVLDGGSVMIGTSTPDQELHVRGSSGIIAIKVENTGITSTDFAGFQLKHGNSSNLWQQLVLSSGDFALASVSGNPTYMTVTSAGNVGIGETAPGSKLSVSGGATIGASYDTTAAPANGLLVEGNVGIGTSSPDAALHVQYSANASTGGLYLYNTNSGAFANTSIRLGNDTYGPTSNSAGLHRLGSANTNYTGANSLMLYQDIAAPIALATNNAVRLTVAGGGNVGIGTTSPATTLSVSGNGYIAGALGVNLVPVSTVDIRGNPSFLGGDGNVFRIGYGGGTTPDQHGGGTTLRGALIAPTLKMVTAGNSQHDGIYVGMHHIADGSARTLTNSANIFIAAATKDANTTVTNAYGIYLAGVDAATNNYQIYSVGTANSYFAGNIGIGTTTPGGLLSVSGGTAYPAFLLNQTSTGDLLTLQDGGSTVFTVKDGGNVGIGTTSPGTTLGVQGNALFAGTTTASVFHATSTTATSTFAGGLTVSSGGGNVLVGSGGQQTFKLGVTPSANAGWNTTNGGSFGIGAHDGLGKVLRMGIDTTLSGFGAAFIQGDYPGCCNLPLIINPGNNAGTMSFVGFGTTDPQSPLHVNWSASSTADANHLTLASPTQTAGPGILFRHNDQNNSIFSSGRIYSTFDGGIFSSARITLQTPTAEEVWTDVLTVRNGKTGVGTTTPFAKFAVHGVATDSNTELLTVASSTASATTTHFVVKNTGLVGISTSSPWRTLSVNGTAAFTGLTNDGTGYYLCLNTTSYQMSTSTTACGASSIRFKENVASINYGLDQVRLLNPVSFDWKKDFIADGAKQIGFIAEEVASVIPEVIGKDAEGNVMNLDYPKLTAVLTKAIQELDEKLNLLAEQGLADSGQGVTTNAWSVDQSTGKVNVNFYGDVDLHGNNLLGVNQIVSQNGLWSINDQGRMVMKFVEAEEIKTNKLIVGSETQPTGITVYDKNGKPGCVSVDDVDSGQFKLAAGICNIQPLSGNQGVVDIVQGIETFAETATTTDAATSGAAASTETATTTPAEGGEPVASTTAKTTSTSEPTQPVVPQESSSPETPSSTNAQ